MHQIFACSEISLQIITSVQGTEMKHHGQYNYWFRIGRFWGRAW